MDGKEHRRIILSTKRFNKLQQQPVELIAIQFVSYVYMCLFINFLINLFLAIPTPAPEGHKA